MENIYAITVVHWIVVIIFGAGFFANVTGPKPIRQEFERWGLPAWLRIITGVGEGVVAVMLIWHVAVISALLIAALIMAAAVLIVLYNQETRRAIVPLVVMILVLISLVQHLS